jgi:hypothetical protein
VLGDLRVPTDAMSVGVVFQPFWYDRADALRQVDQMYADGFRMLAVVVIPNFLTSYTPGYDVILNCLIKAKALGMKLILRLDALYSDSPSEYDFYLKSFARYFDYFAIMEEIERFALVNGMSYGNIVSAFKDWVSNVERYVADPVFFTSFCVNNLWMHIDVATSIWDQVQSYVHVFGLSIYSQDVPDVTIPSVLTIVRSLTAYPVWCTEIGGFTGDWIVQELGMLRRNGVSFAVIWIWETFWGELRYCVRNAEKEQVLSNWIKSQV